MKIVFVASKTSAGQKQIIFLSLVPVFNYNCQMCHTFMVKSFIVFGLHQLSEALVNLRRNIYNICHSEVKLL